ncbi:MAG: AmmeMemoRadiSam system protein B [Candidatus Aminicenantes bacterium]|nr:AmmeMemoRadiSam system protein B [Candidatus Aminicenantes bacterium]
MSKHVEKRILLFLLIACTGFSQGIRKSVWSGQFYPENAKQLTTQINKYIEEAQKHAQRVANIRALIIPHAGYIYSGPIAATAYQSVMGKNVDSVVIIGPSHRFGFTGCSIYKKGGYETPLGVIEVDNELAESISQKTGYGYIPEAHREEHSIEVQVPFIQVALPQAKIVPIVMGIPQRKTIVTLAEALAEILPDKNTLVIASTDMSHFFPKNTANKVDQQTISLIQELKTNALIEKLEARENIMCGGGAVVSSLLYVKKTGIPKVDILAYGDSSRYGGADNVVGYFSGAICDAKEKKDFSLSAQEKKLLLDLARLAINEYVREKKIINYETKNPQLLTKCGAFVTLKKRGQLRGCIGFIEPVAPLYQTIIQAAVYAATQDGRFPPVEPKELESLEIEISVLTTLKRIHDPSRIQVGKHGLVIAQGNKRGLLLPQVPVEQNWSREVFLRQACLKAGLPSEAWRRGAEIYVFEAIVFH